MTRTKDMAMEQQEVAMPNELKNHSKTTQETELTLTPKRLQELSKSDLTDLAKSVVQGVAEGLEDAMDTLIMAKKLELLGKSIVDNVKQYAYGKTYATKGNPYLRFGAKVESAELATEYDYSGCDDPELELLQWQAESAKNNLDNRKKFLQTLPAPIPSFNKDTGETFDIIPAIKKSLNGYKVTL